MPEGVLKEMQGEYMCWKKEQFTEREKTSHSIVHYGGRENSSEVEQHG